LAKKRPAIFLDRDGVLAVEKGYISLPDEVKLFSYAAECIEKIHKKGYYAIVITNQSGVARGLFTERQLIKEHEQVKKETGVDVIYYCPHHINGNVKEYAIKCNCRKPEIGMIEKACKDFEIEIENSYMVGDRACDIMAGRNAGMKTVLLESGYGSANLEKDIKADYIFCDLREFVAFMNELM